MVDRPVEVSPVQADFPIVDPATGKATRTFLYFLRGLWERTGGFTDEFLDLIPAANLGQIQALIAQGQLEAFERKINDAAALARLTTQDRLSASVETLDRRLNLVQALAVASLPPTQNTNVIVFDGNETYRIGPRVQSVAVFCIGGGGGGGGGSTTPGGSGGGGGGGGGYTYSVMDVSTLPQDVAITVGAGGLGGAGGVDGQDGGETSFGTFVYANGGNKGTAGAVSPLGQGGAETSIHGNLYQGGPGADSTLINGADAVNDYAGAPGGGAGGGQGGNGGDGGIGLWKTTSATGGGGQGGAGGTPPAIGLAAVQSDVYLGPGGGGGGGGGASVGDGADGGLGVLGGGGGGGGAIGTGGALAGSGGQGGAGRVIVVEYF